MRNEQAPNLYYSQNIIRIVTSTWMRSVEFNTEAHAHKIFVREPDGRNNLEDLGVDGKII